MTDQRSAMTREEWRKCDLHPAVNPETMWGCPDCLAELRRALRALDVPEGIPPDLLAALRAYSQADMEGVFVNVSREALDKAIELLAAVPTNAAPVQPSERGQCPICTGTGKRAVTSFADPSKMIEKSCSVCHGRGTIKTTYTRDREIFEKTLEAAAEIQEARAEFRHGYDKYGDTEAIRALRFDDVMKP